MLAVAWVYKGKDPPAQSTTTTFISACFKNSLLISCVKARIYEKHYWNFLLSAGGVKKMIREVNIANEFNYRRTMPRRGMVFFGNDLSLTLIQLPNAVSMKPCTIIFVDFLGSKFDFWILFSFCTFNTWPYSVENTKVIRPIDSVFTATETFFYSSRRSEQVVYVYCWRRSDRLFGFRFVHWTIRDREQGRELSNTSRCRNTNVTSHKLRALIPIGSNTQLYVETWHVV